MVLVDSGFSVCQEQLLGLPGQVITILINLGARGWVRGLWKGPCQHLLIGKVLETLLFDDLNGFYLFFVHLMQLFFVYVFSVRHMHEFWGFSGNS